MRRLTRLRVLSTVIDRSTGEKVRIIGRTGSAYRVEFADGNTRIRPRLQLRRIRG